MAGKDERVYATSADQILAIDDHAVVPFEVPEWKCWVHLKTMSGHERDGFEASLIGKKGGQNLQDFRAKLCARVICDADGNLLFTEDQIAKLSKKSAKALDRIVDEAREMNGLSRKDVEELSGNSGSPDSGAT